ncbi:UNKNOWN [Stylonychia lemnae]|uniref:Uncharacterized protein n=1 Tax=Stylonychia lemnae TaxID=5949 RepID=A0A078AHG8_STYLE|nr:UNKNOWN [Stylonychia lemnae]|eukprot:CDW80283.1 UNKNOWN [Stylonychia lemnae]
MRYNLILATVGLVLHTFNASEVLHTIHETPTHHCLNIADVVDEDNYGIIDEIVNCNLKHSDKCQKGLSLTKQNFDCHQLLASLLFNDNFNAITYSYSQNKPNLMRYVADNIGLFSLDDPDFLNYFVYDDFFRSDIFEIVLESLLENQYIMDHKIGLIANLYQDIQVKLMIHTPDANKEDVNKAIKTVKCAMYDELLKAQYAMSFSLAGKIQFDSLHHEIFANVQFPVIDRMLQLANNNSFVYMGPVLTKELKEKYSKKPKKDDDDEEEEEDEAANEQESEEDKKHKYSQLAKARILPVPREQVSYFVAQAIDNLFTSAKKKDVNVKEYVELFEEVLAKQDIIAEGAKAREHVYEHKQRWQPVLFGTDKFEGLQYILHSISANQCPLHQVNRYRGRIETQANFLQPSQKVAMLKVLDQYLNPKPKEPEVATEAEKKSEL